MTVRLFFILSYIPLFAHLYAQSDYWQQEVKYTMNIDMDVNTNRFKGTQKLEYTNHSPDTLYRVFYHLYFNAFQPGSMMDVRSRRQGSVNGPGGKPDWDNRVRDRIYNLKADEIGYQRVLSLHMNGRKQHFKTDETILEVQLDKPLLPQSKAVFEMVFEAQVPLQIRRCGRDNPSSKVRYSMSQWYPKLCEYDAEGWHPTPYVGREFYGVWGDFDVSIKIDKRYVLGGTGYIQNPQQVGCGYEEPGTAVETPKGEKRTWHFFAPRVHDFVWAADPEFKHASRRVKPDLTVHVLYKNTNVAEAEWLGLLDMAERALPYIESTFGAYPYKQFSFIHGGDGGMEYPMATLCIGPGAGLHEWMHSWYYGLLATNEYANPWMDEGFTQYAEDRVNAWLDGPTGFAQEANYTSYFTLAKSKLEEPLSTPADHYNLNAIYGRAVYSKGAVFVEQLGYITGALVRDRILLEYYRQWCFKHPTVADFFKVAERVSGMKLDWYRDYWVHSTKTIDYSIDSVWTENGKTHIRILRNGLMPMPVDVRLRFIDGAAEWHYIPLNLMYGAKPHEYAPAPSITYAPWKWTHEQYVIQCARSIEEITEICIDPSKRMADIDYKNNIRFIK